MKKNFQLFTFTFLLFIFALLAACARSVEISAPKSNENGVLATRAAPNLSQNSDAVLRERAEKINAALKQTPPILLLEELDENQKIAQEVAVKDERFLREVFDVSSKAPLFNEIFGVYPLRESDFVGKAAVCKTTVCYRVEMYNFALNATYNAVVDVQNKQVIVVTKLPEAQPDIPNHLTKIAVHIATNAPELAEALGSPPNEKDVLMANTKTSLNRTRCERSKHLCVAPTFVKNDRAFWAIVDLTELALVGVRQTQVGMTGNAVTEKGLQNEVLTKNYCEKNNKLEQNGWSMDYILTSSDGLRISDVKFNGKPVLRDAKLVDWHVNYSKSDAFGYSDAVGCPVFSQAAVVAVVAPKIEKIVENGAEKGFSLTQGFWSEGYPTPCNYSYEQVFRFYNDGSFRFAAASLGRGCGNDGTYRPVLRLAFAGEQNNFAEFAGNDWQNWQKEAWKLQDENAKFDANGFQYKIFDTGGNGFFIEPSRGQFGDGGRGDNAFVYVTRHEESRDEGDSDLTTIGACCNADYRQGPEKFIEPNPEPLENTSLVVWYVPQMKNDDTKGKEYCWAESVIENGVPTVKKYPCYVGPKFSPIKQSTVISQQLSVIKP